MVLHLPGDFSSVSGGRSFWIHNELDPCGQPWCLDLHGGSMPLFDDRFSSEDFFPGQQEVSAMVSLGLSKLVDRRDADDQPKT